MNSKMEQAVIVTGDFVKTGGMDMPNYSLAKFLADRGVTVHAVAHRVAEDLAQHPQVIWHRVPKPLNSYSLGAPLLDLVGRRVGNRLVSPNVRVVVNGGNCQLADVNWVHYVHAAFQPSSAQGTLRQAKGKFDRIVSLRQERAVLTRARIVIANSERTRQDLVTCLGVDDDRIHTIYYGIDAGRFCPPTETRRQVLRERLQLGERPQVVFIGALGDRRKGFDTLFRAWADLCRSSSWDCDLVVVGRGSELETWKARADDERLGARIRFLGFRPDVPDVLAACDALIAPTRYEAFGLGVLEALCSGLPSIVSRTAGVAELYPSPLKSLLLEDPNSPREARLALENWRAHAQELKGSTVAISEHLRRRNWESMAADIHSLLR